jgi:hypothetical protein
MVLDVYVALCVEVKRYMDSNKDRNEREKLLTFYDALPHSKPF